MFIICYADTKTNEHTFTIVNDYKSFMKNASPNIDVRFVFNESGNIINRVNKYEENFIRNCFSYGFDVSDLHKKYKNKTTNIVYELVGLNTANRRYKLILFNCTTRKLNKVTVNYLSNYCEKLP